MPLRKTNKHTLTTVSLYHTPRRHVLGAKPTRSLPNGLHLKVLDGNCLEEIGHVLIGTDDPIAVHEKERDLRIYIPCLLQNENGLPQHADIVYMMEAEIKQNTFIRHTCNILYFLKWSSWIQNIPGVQQRLTGGHI